MSTWYEREEERRRWRRMIDDMVADERSAKSEQPPAEQPKPMDQKDERLPAHPSSLRSVHRLSIEDQDEWSNRMKNRYGGEW